MDTVENVILFGKEAKGKKELIKHLRGNILTRKEAELAKCYDCCGFYVDGKNDCKIPDCPMYFYMPYRDKKEDKVTKKVRTKKQVDNDSKLRFIRASIHTNNEEMEHETVTPTLDPICDLTPPEHAPTIRKSGRKRKE